MNARAAAVERRTAATLLELRRLAGVCERNGYVMLSLAARLAESEIIDAMEAETAFRASSGVQS